MPTTTSIQQNRRDNQTRPDKSQHIAKFAPLSPEGIRGPDNARIPAPGPTTRAIPAKSGGRAER